MLVSEANRISLYKNYHYLAMQLSKGQTEQGIVVGNTYDKYASKNPLARYLVNGFTRSLEELVALSGARSIHEIGCGEGYWIMRWMQAGLQVRGSDFSRKAIDMARANASQFKLEPELKAESVYDLKPSQDSAELVVCCEVLEHLEQPQQALAVLAELADPYLIVSVPREPVWSWMNMARGKYWRDYGNTPGHIQRWSQRAFIELVSSYVEIIELRAPLPWTMLLCRVNNAD